MQITYIKKINQKHLKVCKLAEFLSNLIISSFSLYIDGLMQDCSNSITDAMYLPQSCAKPSIWNNDL